MNAITGFVNRLHARGLYAEVSLMWAAPGTQRALDHPPILDQDHSPAAWTAIANAFKADPQTILGLQSEPHDITWACWKNGGASCSVGYTAFGMQAALNTIRAAGARNVVTASGIDYANNLQQWLANKPADPLNQLMAEQHVYGGNSCYQPACLTQYTRPVADAGPGHLRRVRGALQRLLQLDEHVCIHQLGRPEPRQLRGVDLGHLGHVLRPDHQLRRHRQELGVRTVGPRPLPGSALIG